MGWRCVYSILRIFIVETFKFRIFLAQPLACLQWNYAHGACLSWQLLTSKFDNGIYLVRPCMMQTAIVYAEIEELKVANFEMPSKGSSGDAKGPMPLATLTLAHFALWHFLLQKQTVPPPHFAKKPSVGSFWFPDPGADDYGFESYQ